MNHLDTSYIPPAARSLTDFTTSQVSDNEIVILDSERFTYHTLNKPAQIAWSLCDGKRSIAEMLIDPDYLAAAMSPESLVLAIDELSDAGLLTCETDQSDRYFDRRKLVQALAAAGIGGVLIPAVSSITAPQGVSAVSRCGDRPNFAPCDATAGCESCCCCGSNPAFPTGSCNDPQVCTGGGLQCV